MKMWNCTKYLLLTCFIFISNPILRAEEKPELLPSALLYLDGFFSHHVLVAEKSTHTLHVFRNDGSYPKHIASYQMATGKKAGDKVFQGDHRTPEGIYFLTDFISHEELLKRQGSQGEIYGVGAFVLDYPNAIDEMAGKTGGGIWIHSTNDETRIEKGLDSRGCIVTANTDLIEISKYIELNRTAVVVVQELSFLKKEAWEQMRNGIKDSVMAWLEAWQQEDFEKYIGSYHKEFRDPTRGGLNAFSQYKKAVFANPGQPQIELDNISILFSGRYAVVTFLQNYTSNTIKDKGRKTLYFKRDEFYNWRIVSEQWTKSGVPETDEQVAFQPSIRFFKSNDPVQIFNEAKKLRN
ncbi:MAG: hypothetical protein Fur0010_02560 [Bdellovibrio sp.]